jgi:hypothetical protein
LWIWFVPSHFADFKGSQEKKKYFRYTSNQRFFFQMSLEISEIFTDYLRLFSVLHQNRLD